jgi:hypothetical protein
VASAISAALAPDSASISNSGPSSRTGLPFELQPRQLQQLDCLLQLGRHDQLL